jgi:hypothetical protein
VKQEAKKKAKWDSLIPQLHLRPLAPRLGELVDRLVGHLDGFVEDLSRRLEIGLVPRLARRCVLRATFLVKLGKGDVEL